jgi:hypothetical protein
VFHNLGKSSLSPSGFWNLQSQHSLLQKWWNIESQEQLKRYFLSFP